MQELCWFWRTGGVQHEESKGTKAEKEEFFDAEDAEDAERGGDLNHGFARIITDFCFGKHGGWGGRMRVSGVIAVCGRSEAVGWIRDMICRLL